MDEKEIEKGNVLIAEFMGAIVVAPIGHTGRDICFQVQIEGQYVYQRSLLKYHTSWDWLMPVVEKINDIQAPDGKKFRTMIMPTQCDISIYAHAGMSIPMRDDRFFVGGKERMIDAAYEAVIKFITWYNTNNPSTH